MDRTCTKDIAVMLHGYWNCYRSKTLTEPLNTLYTNMSIINIIMQSEYKTTRHITHYKL